MYNNAMINKPWYLHDYNIINFIVVIDYSVKIILYLICQ